MWRQLAIRFDLMQGDHFRLLHPVLPSPVCLREYVCSLNGNFISHLAKLHYESRYNPPRKAFDYYAAAALSRLIKSRDLHGLPLRGLFFSSEYGLTLVSEGYDWKATLDSYVSRIDTKVDPTDSDFIKTKKECFNREISIMKGMPDLPHLQVSCCPATVATDHSC
jgi:hypothetical protein